MVELGCGNGRVAVPLAARGYRVTCLEVSPVLAEAAKRYAAEAGVGERLEVVVGDAWRLTQHAPGPYRAAYMIWTTLIGYRLDPRADEELLREARRAVEPGGRLLILRQLDRDRIVGESARCPRGTVVNDLGGVLLVESPRFDPLTSVLENTWTYYERLPDGSLRLLATSRFRLRLYTLTELADIATRAGWRLEAVYGGLSMEPYRPGRTMLNLVLENPS